MKKIVTLSALLFVSVISQVTSGEDFPQTAAVLNSEEMQNQHELMLRQLQELWNQTHQKMEQIDKQKVLETVAPSVIGMTSVPPIGHHQFVAQQSRILVERQPELVRRHQMLLLKQSFKDVRSAISQSTPATALTRPLVQAAEPLMQILMPVNMSQLKYSVESMNRILAEWKTFQHASTRNGLVQQN